MGFRFRRSIRLLPGLRVNFGKSGSTSVSVGGHGLVANFGKKGTRTTIGFPGTGLRYQAYTRKAETFAPQPNRPPPPGPVPAARSSRVWVAILIVIVAALLASLNR